MKALIFSLFAFIVMASGCIKEKSEEEKINTSYYLRFKADGVLKEYTENVLATQSQVATDYVVSIQGQKEKTDTSPGLAVVVTQPEPITAKTYTESTTTTGPALLYRNDASVDHSTLFMTEPSGLEIIISEIGQTTVSGTFKGKVADVNGSIVDITEGQFFAKFQ